MATETTIDYATIIDVKTVQVPRFGVLGITRGQSPTGYGSRITTDYMVKLDGSSIWRRVYCVCYSNAGSSYVFVRGEKKYVRSVDLEK